MLEKKNRCGKCGASARGNYRCDGCRREKDRKRYSELKNDPVFKRKMKENSASWYKRNREEIISKRTDRALQRRSDALKKYGGRCACCGEDQERFLTFDHKNGDGSAHRRAIGNTSTRNFVDWLFRNDFPDTIQVLCFNCNCARAYNKGICPHKQ